MIVRASPSIPRKPVEPAPMRMKVIAVLALAIVGCQDPTKQFNAQRPRPPAASRHEVIGHSVQGRPIDAWTLGDGPDVTLIIASIHGDEPAGTPLVRQFAEHLASNARLLDGRRVIIVPVANPDGIVARSRTNARGVDLNRNYPASNYRRDGNHGDNALSEPESKALHALIRQHQPQRIISFHQPLRSGSACIDYDGPGKALAEAMAAACDLPLVKLGGRPGSLGSYAGQTLDKPIITVELPKESTQWPEARLWERYGKMLRVALDASAE